MIKHPRSFGISKDFSCWYWYLWWWTEQFLEQIVQISVIFISNKSILTKIKEWYHISLTSNISAKTWSNWKCRVCFEIVRTSRFQICPWYWMAGLGLGGFVPVWWNQTIWNWYTLLLANYLFWFDPNDCTLKFVRAI